MDRDAYRPGRCEYSGGSEILVDLYALLYQLHRDQSRPRAVGGVGQAMTRLTNCPFVGGHCPSSPGRDGQHENSWSTPRSCIQAQPWFWKDVRFL